MRPSSLAAPGEAASAASTRFAHSMAAPAGCSARWIGSTCLGWMHSFAPKPNCRAAARSARSRGSSSSCGVTPATGAARPAAREATAMRPAEYAKPSEPASVSRSRSSARSSVPKTSLATPAAKAIASTEATPRALSISASTCASGSAARTAAICSGDSAFGSITCVPPPCSSTRRSIANQPLATSLMRTTMRPRSAAFMSAIWAATASRARDLSSTATASSRSRTTASASLARAFAKRSGRLPGTNR